MKIAIATDWFAPRRGGIETQLAALAGRLASRGHSVTVITSTLPGPAHDAGCEIRRIDGVRIPLTGVLVSPSALSGIGETLDEGFDVVHAHASVISPVAYAAALAASTRGMPAVVTFHSVLRLKRFVLSAAAALARFADSGIVWSAVSDLVARQVAAALGTTEVRLLPNGIDLDFWSSGGGSQSGEARPTFVSTMRLHRKKRPRALLAAFAQAVAHARVPARLVIAGEGPELGSLRRDAGDRVSPDALVELPGWQDAGTLRTLYGRSAAFVLPTRYEAFGIAALEARAAGLPVVALREAGCRAFLRDGENALLCADDADLARAMSRMLREPQLRRRLALRSDGLAAYDWRRVIEEHERAYGDAMRRLSGAGRWTPGRA